MNIKMLSKAPVMMMLVSEPECPQPSNVNNNSVQQVPAQYRGWRITTKLNNGKLWLRWQHPNETFPRYGCPLNENEIGSSIDHVRFLIDLAIKLEEEAAKQKRK